MSDEPKDVEKRMKKDPIWICADVWLGIYPFLPPRQLGLQIAFVGDRFDQLVDGHLKTRKWTFGELRINRKIRKDGQKEMEIEKWVNSTAWKVLPIPEEGIPLPDKVVGFEHIEIRYIDRNVLAFLRRIWRLFNTSDVGINLFITSATDVHGSKIFVQEIWPQIRDKICWMELESDYPGHFRRFAPAILDGCPNLKTVLCYYHALIVQAVTDWVCTPRADGLPKVLWFPWCLADEDLESFQTTFINASSPINFIVISLPMDRRPFVSFELTNELTGERLTKKRFYADAQDFEFCLLVRCPILRDKKQWGEWEADAVGFEWHKRWNKLSISVDDNFIATDLFDNTVVGPSVHHQE